MEQVKSIVELLEKMGFSFWQIFGVWVIVLFRYQIIDILNNVTLIKTPLGEIDFAQERLKIVKELKNVQDTISLSDGTSDVMNKISKGIQSFNEELSIDALKRIKMNTTYLWPALASAYRNQQPQAKAAIRETTFRRIKNDLELLQTSGLLEYSIKYTGVLQNDTINQITIEIHKELFDLIKKDLEGNSLLKNY